VALKHSPKAAALTQLILEIFRINGGLLGAGDKLVAPLGQTSSRWQVLGAIEKAPATVPQIGRGMGISRQSVQRTADLLVKDGLCEFIANPDHQRSPQLRLTKKGVTLLDKITRTQIEWANRLADGLSENDFELARRVLVKLRTRL
jgi:DNA-binding MarR family transcriptional regulator